MSVRVGLPSRKHRTMAELTAAEKAEVRRWAWEKAAMLSFPVPNAKVSDRSVYSALPLPEPRRGLTLPEVFEQADQIVKWVLTGIMENDR